MSSSVRFVVTRYDQDFLLRSLPGIRSNRSISTDSASTRNALRFNLARKSVPPELAPRVMALTAAERMRRWRARRRAAGLKPVVTWVAPAGIPRMPPLDLRVIEARSLALHALIARKIERQPALLDIAHQNLEGWRERGSGAAGAAIRAWRKVLRRSWPEIAALLTEQSEQAVRLRRASPFVSVLSPRERNRVYAAFTIVQSRFSR